MNKCMAWRGRAWFARVATQRSAAAAQHLQPLASLRSCRAGPACPARHSSPSPAFSFPFDPPQFLETGTLAALTEAGVGAGGAGAPVNENAAVGLKFI